VYVFTLRQRFSNQSQLLKSSVLGLLHSAPCIAYDIHPHLLHSSFTDERKGTLEEEAAAITTTTTTTTITTTTLNCSLGLVALADDHEG
jgi:hypothetical protein